MAYTFCWRTLQASESVTIDRCAKRCLETCSRGQWKSSHCERHIFGYVKGFSKFFGRSPRKHRLTVYRGLQVIPVRIVLAQRRICTNVGVDHLRSLSAFDCSIGMICRASKKLSYYVRGMSVASFGEKLWIRQSSSF